MIAMAALVVVAGAASAQTLKATIPFEFRAGNHVMAPGTYRIELSRTTDTPVFEILNVDSGTAIALLPQAPVDPDKVWGTSGKGKLVFECASGSCALAELWGGPDNHYAYAFRRARLGKDETAVLREIPMQPAKGE
jgi:hypothetical protein